MHETLSKLFVDRRDDGAPWADRKALDAALVSIVLEAQRVWQGLAIAPATFVSYLSMRVSSLESLHEIETGDLYLACGCFHNERQAIALFEREYLSRIGAFVRRIDHAPEFVEEVKSRVREKLLLSEAERPPKIAEYSGRGPLAAWLRVVALRTALNVKRERRSKFDTAAVPAEYLHAVRRDPETELAQSHHAREFRDAFHATLRALPSDQRLVLKLHFLDGLNIAEIGLALHVHRATIARWIAHSREGIFEETRRILARRLNLSAAELDGLVGGLKSQLDLSISRCLEESEDASS